jgi:nucleotide-binding universal stress UspA family protein
MLAKLLLPVDFSDRAYGSARYARTLARRFGSAITLIHVLPPPHYEFGALEIGGPMLSELYATRASHLRVRLDNFLRDELHDVTPQRIVLEGDPARRIVEYAHDHAFDLIVMPTHGYGRFRRFILGSITAKVLHDSDVPVWTGVHMEEAPRHSDLAFEHVVCALDLGAHSSAVLAWACRFREAYGARFTIVHATAPLDPELVRPEFDREAREEVETLLERFSAQANIIVEAGDPATVICDALRDAKAGILIIGRSASEGVLGRLRAQAYAIIRQSPCPVISI